MSGGKGTGWLVAAAGLAVAAGLAAWWMAGRPGPAVDPEHPSPGLALPAQVPYEFVWPDGAARGVDVPREILIPDTGQRLPLMGLDDLRSGPGEDKVAFLQRVREQMVDFSERQTFEACALICSDGEGAYSVRMTTVSAVAHCAVAPICVRGHASIQQTIHSHCPKTASFRATLADEILSGGAIRRNRFFGRCDPDRFSSTDFNGWRPGWLAGPQALHHQDGPKRVTSYQ